MKRCLFFVVKLTMYDVFSYAFIKYSKMQLANINGKKELETFSRYSKKEEYLWTKVGKTTNHGEAGFMSQFLTF